MESNISVSVIIPAFNAAAYIAETITSIQQQSFSDWEVIIVNDGSTDNTADIIKPFLNEKINLIHQTNQGVSIARNNGLTQAHGKYVVFLDADDVLSLDFLKNRFEFLEANPDSGFCCGDVLHFTNNIHHINKYSIGKFENIPIKILLYEKGFDSVPSNYMHRKEVLIKNNIRFNPLLSSTADRMFLLELNKYTIGGYVPNAPLYYRQHSDSMSNNFTITLIKDNVLYYHLVEEKKLIPDEIREQALFLKYYIIATSYFKIKHINAISWYFIGFIKYPAPFFKKIFQAIKLHYSRN